VSYFVKHINVNKYIIIEISFTGFTLDKESNTIAIICQDVTVVLAFDTRERLIQWQVKISSNLGDGEKNNNNNIIKLLKLKNELILLKLN